MRKDKEFLFEDRGLGNQRSDQTKSNISTNMPNNEDIHNSFSKIPEKLSDYFAVNGFSLNHNRILINSIFQQTQNGLNVVVIPLSFFKYDKQLWIWISGSSDKILEEYLRIALEGQFGNNLANHKIKVI